MNYLILLLTLTLGTFPFKRVTIVYTSEIAGLLNPRKAKWINPDMPPLVGNAASFKSFITDLRDSLKKENIPILLLDAGGFLGGDLMGRGANPELSIETFNRLGYDLVNVGIRDLHLGKNGLEKMAKLAKFPLISSNLVLANTGKRPDYLVPYRVFVKNGIKIGVFGLISEKAVIFLEKSQSRDFEFLREIETAQKMVNLLRNKEHVDFVIALTNIGMDRDTMLARVVKGLDLIIGGFDGRGLREAYEDPMTHTIYVRTYTGFSDAGVINLYFDPDTRELVGYNNQLVTLFVDRYELDPEFLAWLQKFK